MIMPASRNTIPVAEANKYDPLNLLNILRERVLQLNISANPHPLEALHASELAPTKTLRFGQLSINVFRSTEELNQSIANLISREMQKDGLIVLPSDSTHGKEGEKDGKIYEHLDRIIQKTRLPNDLVVTHMDELKNGKTSFSVSLRSWLPNLMKKLGDRFKAIDPNNFDDYAKLLKTGPRVIVGGIGAEVPAHVAYIGEEQDPITGKQTINNEPKTITLRSAESQRRNCTEAVTMGMNSFIPRKNQKLERVILTAKGEHKAEAVSDALRQAFGLSPHTTGACGEILYEFTNRAPGQGPILNLNLDAVLFKKLLENQELKDRLIQSFSNN
jgi:hypothetical protein